MTDRIEPAIQLYTVRAQLAEDLDGTLARLAEIGYREVEAFGLLEWRDRLADALPRQGIRAISDHADLLGPDRPAILAAAAELGIPLVVQPWTDPTRWSTLDGVAAIADGLAAAAHDGAPSSVRVAYHNHHFELATRIDGRHALEVFAERLAADVRLEIDAYWAHAGGADVPSLVRDLGDRVVALHLKDGDGSLDTSHQVAAGYGVVPLAETVTAAPDALRIVEFDDTSGDLWTAIRDSREYVLGLAGD